MVNKGWTDYERGWQRCLTTRGVGANVNNRRGLKRIDKSRRKTLEARDIYRASRRFDEVEVEVEVEVNDLDCDNYEGWLSFMEILHGCVAEPEPEDDNCYDINGDNIQWMDSIAA